MGAEQIVSPTEFNVTLPPRIDGAAVEFLNLKAGSAAVFLGANGAGKTRLAGWLDKQLGNLSTFIYARRSIDMPQRYSIVGEKEQLAAIYAGSAVSLWADIKAMKDHRYSTNQNPYSSDDFASVLNVLGTRDAAASKKFRAAFDAAPYVLPKKIRTELDAALEIWANCLPHLSIDARNTPELKVQRLDGPADTYDPSDMSDGERAIFYLVAKCLIAPKNSVIIVDEPKMYIHASIRSQLWDAIEQECRDCVFVYCTHDIDFASSRRFVARYVLTKCNPQKSNDRTANLWEYSSIAHDKDIPESVLLNVLGSRQKVLFVEGDATSLDRKLAAACYPGLQLRFLGGCEDVVRVVKALRRTPQVHRKMPAGLIDTDFRSNSECEVLARDNIFVHKMREIENVLVSSKVVEAALTNLAKGGETKERLAALHAISKKRVEGKVELVARKLAIREARMQAFVALDELQHSVQTPRGLAWPDVQEIEKLCIEKAREVWANPKWDVFLSVFSARKDDFRDIAAKQMGFKSWEETEETLLGWNAEPESENGKRLRVAIAHYLPEISPT